MAVPPPSSPARPIVIAKHVLIDAPPLDVYKSATSIDPTVFIRPTKVLPGVASFTGAPEWRNIGDRRRLTLTDGSNIQETLTDITPGAAFAYDVTGFQGPLGKLLVGAKGQWRVAADNDDQTTRLEWEYVFLPANPISRVLLNAITRRLWPAYMTGALQRLKETVEQAKTGA